MTKRDLVGKIADVTQLHQEEVMTVVQKTLDYIAEELADGRCVELRNFGVFEIVVRRERKGRNPKKPANEVVIPESACRKVPRRKSFKRKS